MCSRSWNTEYTHTNELIVVILQRCLTGGDLSCAVDVCSASFHQIIMLPSEHRQIFIMIMFCVFLLLQLIRIISTTLVESGYLNVCIILNQKLCTVYVCSRHSSYFISWVLKIELILFG